MTVTGSGFSTLQDFFLDFSELSNFAAMNAAVNDAATVAELRRLLGLTEVSACQTLLSNEVARLESLIPAPEPVPASEEPEAVSPPAATDASATLAADDAGDPFAKR